MARIKFSGIISEISGSIGGATFQRNAAGNSIRNKPRSVNKYGTASQNNVRKIMSGLQNNWLILSDLDKYSWEAAALYYSTRTKHNSNKELTAYQLFIKHNMLLLLSGRPIVTAPTLTGTAFNFASIVFSVAAGHFYMNITADSLNTNNWLLLKVSGIQKLSQSYQPGRCKNLSPLPAGSAEYDITNLYNALFAVIPAVGNKISYQVTLFGLLSPNIQDSISGTEIIQAH
jgi:hypothetical protein